MSDYPKGVRIKGIVQESNSIKTFRLETEMDAEPGQFVMVWVPRVDEKPFTLSSTGEEVAVSVMKRGMATAKMFEMKEGDFLGIRGPYGKGFNSQGVKKACVVAGGCGTAAVATLVEELKKKTDVIIGARTANELCFAERLGKKARKLYITTDDGSEGAKGFVTNVLEELLQTKKYDTVYTCGPEIMMYKVFHLCEKKGVECQASFERYMKCGFGVCGQCAVDGLRVCADGPVFNSSQMRGLKEFGQYARLKSGKKVTLKEYGDWRGE